MFKVYDNFTFRCKVGGLTADCDYKLKVTFMSRRNNDSQHHKIVANGIVIYDGVQFGERDEAYDLEMLAPGFESADYIIPKSVIENGCVDLEFSESEMGVMFSEFIIKKM